MLTVTPVEEPTSRVPVPGLPTPRPLDHRRLRSAGAAAALVAAGVAALGQALGTAVVGRIAAHPTLALVATLALCLVGGAVLDTVGRTLWAVRVDRAEGVLRADLLDAVMRQPLSVLTEQSVGEVLDRIDDDTHELGSLLRQNAWMVIRLMLSAGPLLVVAGLTFWPAWVFLPVVTVAVLAVIRPLMGPLTDAKVVEEIAWTDHAAVMEEGVAARSDLRTSLGQSHVVRRCAELAAVVHARFHDVVVLEARITRRSGGVLHAMLAGVAVVGVVLAVDGKETVAALVTLFLVTTTIVGQLSQVAHHLPDLQAGMGALLRLRTLLACETEPVGGDPLPPGGLSLDLRRLRFAYPEGGFALQDIDLYVPPGTTCALVGRSGSGKSTLASLISRAVDPPRGSVLLGGADTLDLDLQQLRGAVGVVTQRTEILAGTLEQNITLFADLPRARVDDAVTELGIGDWVAGLPDGLDTVLGPSGTSLSAGEEQLVAFARLLVRHVRVVVLDEATARMDPVTESRVVAASQRLLSGRTGLLVAHRLSTTERADQVAVLADGRIVQQGPRAALAASEGPFRELLAASDEVAASAATTPTPAPGTSDPPGPVRVGTARRRGDPPPALTVGTGPGLARGTWTALSIHPRWGWVSVALFSASALLGAYGAVTGWIWGHVVSEVGAGGRPWLLLSLLVLVLLLAPQLLASAISRYPRWWVAVLLRARTSVLVGQTAQHRLPPTPPGEVVARAMDADRYARYADRWVDLSTGLLIALVTGIAGQSVLAGLLLLAVMALTAVASAFGAPVAGRSAAAASDARARFGRSLVSALDCVRTVKLAAATRDVHRHLQQVDSGRVGAAVREHRVQSVLDGVPVVLVQVAVVAAWAAHLAGWWSLATALLVSSAVSGFDWFGRVAGAVVTEAPGTRAWQRAMTALAGGGDLMTLPEGVDLVTGAAPRPATGVVDRLHDLELRGLTAIHDDGTIGASDVDLTLRRGELVLLLGQIGSGKSSLLSALAGLVPYRGSLRWNGAEVDDPQTFLRPGRVAHVAQVPRVLSGSFAANIHLDHPREVSAAVRGARLQHDVAEAGGVDARVGHRGVRLSGGQVQRLALARALATDAELLVADDVSSALDAVTELQLWDSMRERGSTVIGATTKRAALGRADRVVVLVDGRVAAQGPWRDLEARWGHLAG
ncbi:ABC transporter ATP-binding protein [Dermatophilaceae bacterium Soc4.6]